MIKVAVSQRIDVWPDRGERRDALDQALIGFLGAVGVVPVPVPNALDVEGDSEGRMVTLDDWMTVVQPDGVVLSGGNDIGSCADRDGVERALLDRAEREGIPVLGICRGMQMLGIWAGAELKRVESHVRTMHSLVGEIAGQANSFHDYALSACPQGFRVIARSEDGEIEAIGHESLPIEGWMWHPERGEIAKRDLERAKTLLFGRSGS